jgi:hypothetical protein
MCTDVFHLGSQHRGPFWLPMRLLKKMGFVSAEAIRLTATFC